jgi:hypothetical protein
VDLVPFLSGEVEFPEIVEDGELIGASKDICFIIQNTRCKITSRRRYILL